MSKEDFCTGLCNVTLEPQYISVLTAYLKYCDDEGKEPNWGGTFRRHVLLNLLDSATPIVHKAYFDSKTNLKDVVAFVRMKMTALEFEIYSDLVESDIDEKHHWRNASYHSRVIYSPTGCGCYDKREDTLLCQQLMTEPHKGKCGCDHAGLDKNKLMEVAKYTRQILFPLFNLTIPLKNEDAAYLIIDMYILAKRCFGNEGASAECDSILQWIKKDILLYVSPAEFDRVRERIEETPLEGHPNVPQALKRC